MSLKQIAEGYSNLIKKGVGVANKDIEDLAVERYTICLDCSKRVKNKCGECGCLLSAKVRSVKASCPKSKW